MYEIRFMPPAEKYFRKLKEKPLIRAYREALNKIADNPYAGDARKGDLAGLYGWDVFYARTNYEIAYRIYEENEQLVVVVLAGSSENFYEQLKRYIR